MSYALSGTTGLGEGVATFLRLPSQVGKSTRQFSETISDQPSRERFFRDEGDLRFAPNSARKDYAGSHARLISVAVSFAKHMIDSTPRRQSDKKKTRLRDRLASQRVIDARDRGFGPKKKLFPPESSTPSEAREYD